jgi:hypothetical protein
MLSKSAEKFRTELQNQFFVAERTGLEFDYSPLS